MNGREVIGEDMQRERGGKVGFLFGKARGQARHPAHPSSQTKVSAFDVSRGSQFQVGIATNRFAFDGFQLTGTIPLSTIFHFPVVFDFLRVIDFRSESILNRGLINAPTIGRNLKAISDAVLQFADEPKSRMRIAFTKRVSWDKFVLGDSQKHPLIAVIERVFLSKSAIFLLHERPAFVYANLFGLNVSQFTVKNDRSFD